MLDRLNALYPVRYTVLALCVLAMLLSLFALLALGVGGWPFLFFGGLSALGWWDLQQTHRAVLRNYPIIGHLRYMLEKVRPEIRQYFLESDAEATPFSRSQPEPPEKFTDSPTITVPMLNWRISPLQYQHGSSVVTKILSR